MAILPRQFTCGEEALQKNQEACACRPLPDPLQTSGTLEIFHEFTILFGLVFHFFID
jgi:hypothetical protein